MDYYEHPDDPYELEDQLDSELNRQMKGRP